MQGHREDQGCRGHAKDPGFGTSLSLGVRVAVRWVTSASRDSPARGRGQGRGLAGTSGSSSPSPAGTLSCEEEVAPLAGPSLPPSPRGPGHVHPHIAHADQFPQHQADSRCMTSECPHLAHHLTTRIASPFSSSTFLWVLPAMQALVGAERREAQGGLRNQGRRGPKSQCEREPSREVAGTPRDEQVTGLQVLPTPASGWILTVTLL